MDLLLRQVSLTVEKYTQPKVAIPVVVDLLLRRGPGGRVGGISGDRVAIPVVVDLLLRRVAVGFNWIEIDIRSQSLL